MHASALADHTPGARRVDGTLEDTLPRLLSEHGPVHVHFTDRIFGSNAAAAASVFEELASRRPVSVTLHDIPQPSDGRSFAARSDAYSRVVAHARAVVVSSRFERDLLLTHAEVPAGREIHVDPLPIDPPALLSRPGEPASGSAIPTVGLLGFIYPGKGHHQVLAALGLGNRPADVVALGRASDGHRDLIDQLMVVARERGRRFRATGFLSEKALTAAARKVTVPVVAPTHVSASGSVGRWIASGRRPVVTHHPFFEELRDRAPWALTLTDDLPTALDEALADPRSTWIDPRLWDERHVPSTARAAAVQWSRLTGHAALREVAEPILDLAGVVAR